MFRQFKPTRRNLSIVLDKLEEQGHKESINFRNCLRLATKFGPRGDEYFALEGLPSSSGGWLDEDAIGSADAFLKLDSRGMIQ